MLGLHCVVPLTVHHCDNPKASQLSLRESDEHPYPWMGRVIIASGGCPHYGLFPRLLLSWVTFLSLLLPGLLVSSLSAVCMAEVGVDGNRRKCPS